MSKHRPTCCEYFHSRVSGLLSFSGTTRLWVSLLVKRQLHVRSRGCPAQGSADDVWKSCVGAQRSRGDAHHRSRKLVASHGTLPGILKDGSGCVFGRFQNNRSMKRKFLYSSNAHSSVAHLVGKIAEPLCWQIPAVASSGAQLPM